MLKLLISAIAGLTAASKCPARTSIQSEEVQKNFDMKHLNGTYYEIAYHDATQPAPVCGCQRIVRTWNETTKQIDDAGTLNCGNFTGDNTHSHTYVQPLTFDLDKAGPGVWDGNWPLMPGVVFPDALVDFGHVKEDGQYAWVLEMQCVEILGHVAFVGVNFYSSVPEHTYLEEMKAAWHARGLDDFIYPAHGAQLTLVNQTGCLYDNKNWSEYDPKYENMKQTALGPKLLLAQGAHQKFDLEAAEKKVQEELATMDIEAIVAKRQAFL